MNVARGAKDSRKKKKRKGKSGVKTQSVSDFGEKENEEEQKQRTEQTTNKLHQTNKSAWKNRVPLRIFEGVCRPCILKHRFVCFLLLLFLSCACVCLSLFSHLDIFQLLHIAEKLRKSGQVPIKDRRSFLKSYPKCFIGA
jgi:hypothetical protein